jgi:hypothetical protein
MCRVVHRWPTKWPNKMAPQDGPAPAPPPPASARHLADCERRGPLDGVDGAAVAAAAEALEERADRGPVLRRGAFKTPRSLYGSTKDTAHLEAPST